MLALSLTLLPPSDPRSSVPTPTPGAIPMTRSLNDLLETWSVLDPEQWENESGPMGWFAVCNDHGIVAYFADERDAYRYRLSEINRTLNP